MMNNNNISTSTQEDEEGRGRGGDHRQQQQQQRQHNDNNDVDADAAAVAAAAEGGGLVGSLVAATVGGAKSVNEPSNETTNLQEYLQGCQMRKKHTTQKCNATVSAESNKTITKATTTAATTNTLTSTMTTATTKTYASAAPSGDVVAAAERMKNTTASNTSKTKSTTLVTNTGLVRHFETELTHVGTEEEDDDDYDGDYEDDDNKSHQTKKHNRKRPAAMSTSSSTTSTIMSVKPPKKKNIHRRNHHHEPSMSTSTQTQTQTTTRPKSPVVAADNTRRHRSQNYNNNEEPSPALSSFTHLTSVAVASSAAANTDESESESESSLSSSSSTACNRKKNQLHSNRRTIRRGVGNQNNRTMSLRHRGTYTKSYNENDAYSIDSMEELSDSLSEQTSCGGSSSSDDSSSSYINKKKKSSSVQKGTKRDFVLEDKWAKYLSKQPHFVEANQQDIYNDHNHHLHALVQYGSSEDDCVSAITEAPNLLIFCVVSGYINDKNYIQVLHTLSTPHQSPSKQSNNNDDSSSDDDEEDNDNDCDYYPSGTLWCLQGLFDNATPVVAQGIRMFQDERIETPHPEYLFQHRHDQKSFFARPKPKSSTRNYYDSNDNNNEDYPYDVYYYKGKASMVVPSTFAPFLATCRVHDPESILKSVTAAMTAISKDSSYDADTITMYQNYYKNYLLPCIWAVGNRYISATYTYNSNDPIVMKWSFAHHTLRDELEEERASFGLAAHIDAAQPSPDVILTEEQQHILNKRKRLARKLTNDVKRCMKEHHRKESTSSTTMKKRSQEPYYIRRRQNILIILQAMIDRNVNGVFTIVFEEMKPFFETHKIPSLRMKDPWNHICQIVGAAEHSYDKCKELYKNGSKERGLEDEIKALHNYILRMELTDFVPTKPRPRGRGTTKVD